MKLNFKKTKVPKQNSPNPAVGIIDRAAKSIPFLSVPDTALVSTTQDFVPVADVTNDIILFKNGGASLILESSSLNFGLLSEKEQEAVVSSYAALMNSLSFAVQIQVRSQKKDIGDYLDYLDEWFQKTTNSKLQELMTDYRRFMTESVKKRNVLGKRFYIILPLSPLELGVAKSFASVIKKGQTLPFSKNYVIKKAKITLYPRRDHIIRQAGRLGLRLTQLKTNQLIRHIYDIFNPELPGSARKMEQQ